MGAPILFFLGYFIVFITILTLLWKITLALESIGQTLKEMSKDIKTAATRSENKPEK